MEIQHIKQIAITDYLQQQGYALARVHGIHCTLSNKSAQLELQLSLWF